MIGARIKQARVAAGMTQDDVVEALSRVGVSLTKGGLSKYERGGSNPRATVLRGLASVLGVDHSYFVEESSCEVTWLAFRKASRLGKTRQQRVKAIAEAQIEMFMSLRRALEPNRHDEFPPRVEVREFADSEKAAERLRSHWRLGDQPIESVTRAIEDGGGLVVESGGEDDLFDGLSGWVDETIPVVVVSAAVSDDRRRFSLAHELGHLMMDVGNVDSPSHEKLAHRFAAAFLVTAVTARRELGEKRRHLKFRELGMLKRKHGLSMQAWVFRAMDLGIVEESHGRTLFAEMSARGWRRKEPVQFEGQERPTRLLQLTVRALAEGLLSRVQAERIYPGVTCDIEDEAPMGAMDARAVIRLPKTERDRLMKQAATTLGSEYEHGGDLAGMESLAEEDHRDTSVED